jgi:uncharacterized protein YdhG (YjbR/CyaY superfamily)
MTEIEAYIESLNEPLGEIVCQRLNDLYKHLKTILPEATECISYGMPCFKQNNKPVVYFAGYKKHIGFYPTAKPIEQFKDQLVPYKTSKGAIQFNINEPLPFSLIDEIVSYNLFEIKLKIK